MSHDDPYARLGDGSFSVSDFFEAGIDMTGLLQASDRQAVAVSSYIGNELPVKKHGNREDKNTRELTSWN